jgi:hypothetical protein
VSSIVKFESLVREQLGAVHSPVSFDNPFAPASGFFDIIKKALEDLKDDLPPKDEVLEYVGRFFDAFIEPIDLPGVPNFAAEPMLDKLLRSVAIAATAKLYDRLMGS